MPNPERPGSELVKGCVFRVLNNTDSGTNLTAIPVLS